MFNLLHLRFLVLGLTLFSASSAYATTCGPTFESNNGFASVDIPATYKRYKARKPNQYNVIGKLSVGSAEEAPISEIYGATWETLGKFNYEGANTAPDGAYAYIDLKLVEYLQFDGFIFENGVARSLKTKDTVTILGIHEIIDWMPALNQQVFGRMTKGKDYTGKEQWTIEGGVCNGNFVSFREIESFYNVQPGNLELERKFTACALGNQCQ